jgi:hypothetical protein
MAKTSPVVGSRKRLAARLALLGGTLVLCLLALEAAIRLLGAVSPPMTERDPVVGQRLVRSFAGKVYDAESKQSVLVRTDREGFRGPDRPYEKPQDVRRVAILGDSMIAALSVEEDQTLVARLEQLLNRTSPGGPRWEVFNFGVPGASTGQELALWRATVRKYRPDVVLCAFFVGNDLADNSRRLSSNPRIYFELDDSGRLVERPLSAAKTGLSAWLNRHSRLYVWQKEAFRHVHYAWLKQARVLEPGLWIYSKQPPEAVAAAWKLTGALLAQWADEARAAGSRFGVVLIPTAQQVYRESLLKALASGGAEPGAFDADYPERKMDELCRASGVPLLSMIVDFRRAAPSRSLAKADEWLFLRGEGHFNPRGHQFAAETIYRWIASGNPPPFGTSKSTSP